MNERDFTKIVEKIGLSVVPKKFRDKIRNVAFIVEDEPHPETLRSHGLSYGETLLGLYHGIPHTERGDQYGVGVVLPDTITLYRKPIEKEAEESGKSVKDVVRETIWHEVAHHFGFTDEEIDSRGHRHDSITNRQHLMVFMNYQHQHTGSDTHDHAGVKSRYALKDFLPLIGALSIVFLLTLIFAFMYGAPGLTDLMRLFMGSFFLAFGTLKVINIRGFADAYSVYDVITKRIRAWGYVYPFIELALAFAYIFGISLFVVNWITVFVMLVGALGVFLKLLEREVVPCACLGAIFKIPMTWVTLFEDVLMAAMAGAMLFAL